MPRHGLLLLRRMGAVREDVRRTGRNGSAGRRGGRSAFRVRRSAFGWRRSQPEAKDDPLHSADASVFDAV